MKKIQISRVFINTVAYSILVFSWILVVLTPVVAVFLILGGVWALGLIALGFAVFQLFFLKDIPAEDPPSVLHITWWGIRTDIVLTEGWKVVAKWTGISGILTSVEKRNKDFDVTVRCRSEAEEAKSGGEVRVQGTYTYTPDTKRLINFENYGSDDGIKKQLDSLIEEKLRQEAIDRTWQQMEFAKDDLVVGLVLHIVENSTTEDDKLEKYKDLSDEQKQNTKFVSEFLSKLLTNGVGDEHDLGIKLHRLNIKNIEVVGELRADAEKEAREFQQRRAELVEAETIRQVAEVLAPIDPAVREDAMVIAGKISKKVVGGNAQDFTKGAALNSSDEVKN